MARFYHDWLDKVAIAVSNLLALKPALDLAAIVSLQIIAISFFWELRKQHDAKDDASTLEYS